MNTESAFPRVGFSAPISDDQWVPSQKGMTLRDYLAAAAVQGMCANPDLSTHMTIQGMKPGDVRLSFAESAYKLADEMLKARSQ